MAKPDIENISALWAPDYPLSLITDVRCPCGKLTEVTLSPNALPYASHWSEKDFACVCGRTFSVDVYCQIGAYVHMNDLPVDTREVDFLEAYKNDAGA